MWPRQRENILNGTAIKTINLCTTSLSKAKGNTPDERIMNEGTKKQCKTHIKDTEKANLSVVNWVLIILGLLSVTIVHYVI